MLLLFRILVVLQGCIGALLLIAAVCLGDQEEDNKIGRIRGENGQLSLVIAVPLTNECVIVSRF
jgi:hypothetical protein